MTLRAQAAWLALGLLLSPALAEAQLGASTGTGNNLNIEHYQPSLLGLAVQDRARGQVWREYSVGIFAHYARNPLVLFADRLQIGEVVGHRLSLDLVGSIGLLDFLELGLAIPVTLYQLGDSGLPTGDLDKTGFRDLRVQAKLTILTQERTGIIGLSLVPELSIPVGSTDSFLGDGNVTFSPTLLVDRRFDILFGFRIGAGFGIKLRPRAEIGNVEIGNEFYYRAGAGLGLPNLLDLHPEAIAELSGTSRIDELFEKREQNPFLGRLGLRVHSDLEPGHRVIYTGGVSAGATRGYGAPDFQVFLGAIYQRYLSDRDGDLIWDDDDACPDDPEDRDDFEDSDGCPEPDNDKDGLPDTADRCPNDPEDFDQFEDLDGCPEPDNDKDGIPDTQDKCPNDPEDPDGFEDQDGCPDPDNDRDGIPDAEDKCPGEKEVINGELDEDGCPDEGETHVEVTSEKVTIDSKIMFDFDSDRIRSESFSILNQVALTLKANPQLLRIRIEGHTDEQGRADYNRSLSQRRATSVMRYLIQRGVEERRLEAEGYGEDKPLVSGHDEAAWAKNRRVEFTILEQEGASESGTRPLEPPAQ
ncbi:MAG: OmpA family protein [Deltaproteobacteria bacterium]|nr:OmpA family protein [Deltaproteobacteria bacterium]